MALRTRSSGELVRPQALSSLSNGHGFVCSWPRSIVLGSDDGDVNEQTQSNYYSEYTGRISRGASQSVVVNALSAPSMHYLDNLVQQSTLQGGDNHIYFYALE